MISLKGTVTATVEMILQTLELVWVTTMDVVNDGY
jgi:hypothetical protein